MAPVSGACVMGLSFFFHTFCFWLRVLEYSNSLDQENGGPATSPRVTINK